jgi:HlyD family secretion protein
MKKWWLGIAVLALATAAIVYYIRGRAATPVEKYRTEPAARGDVTMTVTATGTIAAVVTVQVGSQVSGIIARLHADFNSPVKRGQLLAELDPTPFQSRVDQQRANVLQAEVGARRAQLDFDRQKRLLDAALSSQADFDAARAVLDAASAEVEQANAALKQARTDLAYTRIASPIDGVVVARQYDVGQTVAASFQAPTLFTIAQDLKKMQVQADVDQSDIGRVKVGQKARFTVDAYPDQEFVGSISQIRLNATANQNVISYPVIIAVDNPEEKLRPQMTANVTVDVATVHDVLRIPNAALRFRPTQQAGSPRADASAARPDSGGGPPGGAPGQGRAGRQGGRGGGFAAASGQLATAIGETGGGGGGRSQAIFVLDPGGKLRRVAVRTGISDGRFTQIVDGELKEGDPVVVGQATAKVETAARPPGGGRMF